MSVIMEKTCDNQESDFNTVNEVTGEPAIIINGVPNSNPGGTSSTLHLGTTSNMESDDDPCFGELLVGRKIRKLFGDQYYSGEVEMYDKETKWYRVVYEDSDFEDLEWHELEQVLVPLDVSIPLETLALDRYQLKRSTSQSHIERAKVKKTDSLEAVEEQHLLLETPQPNEGKLLEANLGGMTHLGTSQLQNGLQIGKREAYLEECMDDEPSSESTSLNSCNGKDWDWDPTVVFEVKGEPAIVINGVPDVTPGGEKSIHMDTVDSADMSSDPYFGEWIEGRKVQKKFGDQHYSGKVEKYDRETKWYRVVYEDSDFEDLEWHELHDLLVPLDISIPITALALNRFKPDKSISASQINMTKERKNRTGVLKGTKRTSDALLTSQVGKMMDGKPIGVNFIESSKQGTSQMQPENIEPQLQMHKPEESVFKLEEEETTLKDNQSGENVIIQKEAHGETSFQECEKDQRTFQNQNQTWKTARAEKERRREKSSVQDPA